MKLRLLFACAVLALAANAGAQDARSIVGRVVFVGDTPFRVIQRWGSGGGSIEVSGPNGSTRGALPGPGWMSAAARDDGVLVAIAESGPAAVRTVWIPIANGRPGAPHPITIPRIEGEGFAPVGIAIAARPDGFSVLWQEASTASPMETWRTYEARLDAHGDVIGAPRQLAQVPWPIADAVHVNGTTWLLLYYGTNDPRRTRLCTVRIDDAGTPLEHPRWSSREGMIGEAHIVPAGDRIFAVYRGGPDGDRLLEADVSQGSWGQEVREPRGHGPIDPLEAYGERAEGERVRIERVRLGGG